MTANAELLQGSLFGDVEPQSNAESCQETITQALGIELSDQELVDESLRRPRNRHQPTSVPNIPLDSESQEQLETADNDNDQPAWAHHSLVEP